MRVIIFLLFTIVFVSCNDGDIIITGFSFNDAKLELCKGAKENEYVFFKINTENNEAIAYRLIDKNYSDTIATEEPITIKLNKLDNNSIIYRKFDRTVKSDYYCSNIPPIDIQITEELVGISGNVEITNKIISEDDNDGIPAEEEDLNKNGNLEDDDTDNDGIPNYKDQDDDNDNILTSVEIQNGIPDNDNPRDTDNDLIPDYLDNDDDNDNILTINEDLDKNGNPRDDDYDNDGIFNFLDNDDDNDSILTANEDTNKDKDPRNDDDDNDGIPNYLDTDSENDSAGHNEDLPHKLKNTIKTTYRTIITIIDLIFDKNNQNFDDRNFSFGNRDVTISKTTN